MTETEWLSCRDARAMLAFLEGGRGRARPAPADRSLRLLACAVLSTLWPVLSPLCRKVLDAATGLADAGASLSELSDTYREICHGDNWPGRAADDVERAVVALVSPYVSPVSAAERALDVARDWDLPAAHLLRDVLGNPFVRFHDGDPRPPCRYCHGTGRLLTRSIDAGGDAYATIPVYCKACLGRGSTRQPWLTAEAEGLARAAHYERTEGGWLDPLRLAVLADCLEEAGCPAGTLLYDLRGYARRPGGGWARLPADLPRPVGLWSLDRVTGRGATDKEPACPTSKR